MFFKVLLLYILGYVEIEVEGFFIERFINICTNKKIFLWNLRREKSVILHARISPKEFKKVREISKNTKCKVKIKSKKGLPFIINRYRKRKIFLACALILIIMIFTLSKFIWNIEIKGNTNIPKEEIVELLKNNGITEGIYKDKIDVQAVINKIRLERKDIAWMGISFVGTNAIVEIAESIEKPEEIDENEYCNIIADKDAIILKISVQEGTAAVSQGDIVKKGDILAYGRMEGKYTGTRYVHAKADIEAKVWYSKKVKVSKNQTYYNKTGNEEKKYSININNFKINLYKTLSNFKNYDTIRTSKKIVFFSNWYFPIQLQIITNYELEDDIKLHSAEEIKNNAINNLKEELKKEIDKPENILDEEINITEDEENYEIKLVYIVKEKIGINERIVF